VARWDGKMDTCLPYSRCNSTPISLSCALCLPPNLLSSNLLRAPSHPSLLCFASCRGRGTFCMEEFHAGGTQILGASGRASRSERPSASSGDSKSCFWAKAHIAYGLFGYAFGFWRQKSTVKSPTKQSLEAKKYK